MVVIPSYFYCNIMRLDYIVHCAEMIEIILKNNQKTRYMRGYN